MCISIRAKEDINIDAKRVIPKDARGAYNANLNSYFFWEVLEGKRKTEFYIELDKVKSIKDKFDLDKFSSEILS